MLNRNVLHNFKLILLESGLRKDTTTSSASSSFSMFNPNEELKMFF